MKKSKKIIIAVVAVLVIIAAIVGTRDFLSCRGQSPVPYDKTYGFTEKSDDAIRVMSFNIRCTNVGLRSQNKRVPDVVTTILNGMPDSFGVQEATPEWMETLTEEIGDTYEWVGVGRNGGNKGEYSAIFYLKDKYTATESGTFWLSPTPEKPSKGWDAAFKRICTWVILENKETGEKYIHMNSHFDHVGEEARSNSLRMIVEKSKEYEDIPAVFTADMNVKEGSKNYKEIADNSIFKDTKYTAENVYDYITYHDRFPEEHPDSVIDYCFANEGFEAITYCVVTESPSEYYVSDHFPVYTDLRFK